MISNSETQIKRGKSLIVRNIDPAIHKRLKMRCAQEETSIQAKLMELIENFVKGK